MIAESVNDKDMVKLTRKYGPIHVLVKKWEITQRDSKKEILDAKADINVITDKNRSAGICKLTTMGTSTAGVNA